jgi:hypothetical protein
MGGRFFEGGSFAFRMIILHRLSFEQICPEYRPTAAKAFMPRASVSRDLLKGAAYMGSFSVTRLNQNAAARGLCWNQSRFVTLAQG